MSKTTALRTLVAAQLNTVEGETYHKRAGKAAAYPYKVYTIDSVAFPDSARDDSVLTVDIWDRAPDQRTIEALADKIERLFNDANLPAPPIYPTFFRDARVNLDDPDKDLQHIQLRFLVQLYETIEMED